MKSAWSLFAILFLIGIPVECSALSFFTVLENGRFGPEKVMEWNATLPWVNFNVQLEINQSNCSRDIRLLAEDLKAKKIWALKSTTGRFFQYNKNFFECFLAFDAWGRIPSGIMQGNIYWIGSPYECGHHLRGLNNTVVEQPFRTRTCVIRNDYSDRMEPVYGMCVPQSCNTTDIFNYIIQGIF